VLITAGNDLPEIPAQQEAICTISNTDNVIPLIKTAYLLPSSNGSL
jgi:hypothetical protein